MIISHKFKFIFVKTMKTAGTSIEVDFNKFLGVKDIATPILPKVKGHKPLNFEESKSGITLFNHLSASNIKQYIGEKIFDDYFVFCVEREPVDKCISHYSMLKNSPNHNKRTKKLSFEQYIYDRKFPIDSDKYTDSLGNLIVNRILHYENLQKELIDIEKELGFKPILESRIKKWI